MTRASTGWAKGVVARVGQVLLWLLTAMVLVVLALAARIMVAPLELGPVRQAALDAVSDRLPGWTVQVDQATLAWDWRAVRPRLALEQVRLIAPEGRVDARIPAIALGITAGRRFPGFDLATLGVMDARISLRRSADHVNGADAVPAPALATDTASIQKSLPPGLKALADTFAKGQMPVARAFRPVATFYRAMDRRLADLMPDLDSVRLNNLMLTLEGNWRSAGVPDGMRRLTVPEIVFDRSGGRLDFRTRLDLPLGAQGVTLSVSATGRPDAGALAMNITLDRVVPADLAGIMGVPVAAAMVQVPVTATLDMALDRSSGLTEAALYMDLGQGHLRHPRTFPMGAPIRYGTINLSFDPLERVAHLQDLDLGLAPGSMRGSGIIYFHEKGRNPGIDGMFSLSRASVQDILHYWPARYHPDGSERGGRAWMRENMHEGTVSDITLEVDWRPDGSGGLAGGTPFLVTFDVSGVATRYVKHMPDLTGANGSGTLTHQALDIRLNGAETGGVPLSEGRVYLDNIMAETGKTGTFDLRMKDDLGPILELLSNRPVDLDRRLNIALDRLGGQAVVDGRIRIPMDSPDIPRDQIRYDASARITAARVDDLLDGEGLRDGALDLTVTNEALTVAGSGRVNGVPLDLRWREDLTGGDDPDAKTSLLVASGTVDEDELQALGVDVTQWIRGPVRAEAAFRGRALKFTDGNFSADLSRAAVYFEQMSWRKPEGVAATATGTLLMHDGWNQLAPLTLSGEHLDATLNLDWSDGGGVVEMAYFDAGMDIREMGENRLQFEARQRGDGAVQVTVDARRFDARPFLNQPADRQGMEPMGVALEMDVTADELLLLGEEGLRDVSLETRFSDNAPEWANLTGKLMADDAFVDLSIRHVRDGPNAVIIQSDNGGAVLRGLGVFAHLEGGAMTLEGHTRGWDQDLWMEGTLKVTDTRILTQADLNPAVEEGVVSGLSDLVDEGGDRLGLVSVPFVYDRGLMDFEGVQANGPRFGMTLEGQLHVYENKINVNGVYVPAYGLNSLVGNIPLIGGLLTGGEGKGLIGFSYRVKGAMSAPDVTVSAVSGLAPGFLRGLFERGKGQVADVDIPDAAEKDEDGDTPDGNDPGTEEDAGDGDGDEAPRGDDGRHP
ncbi:YhdP family protein [Yunchengibacter salinarum]|uniref:YhdP family protein n=1 Tax=Yunchengibacter salinarum TaxID=3133399 RepID=UPI0035B60D8F